MGSHDLVSPNCLQPAHQARGDWGLHVIALLTAIATFPLIFIGGLVTSHHAGMSVPDWPNSYHYNMFLFPPSKWVGGIFYEHTHRLMASAVGFLSIIMVLWAWGVARTEFAQRRLIIATCWAGLAAAILGAAVFLIGSAAGQRIAALNLQTPRGQLIHAMLAQAAVGLTGLAAIGVFACFARTREPRRWVRWLAFGALGMVLVQGILGGLRVVLVNLDLAIVHACVAQAFFCLATFAAIVTSRWWMDAPVADAGTAGRWRVGLGIATVAIIYLQLVVGATMRHFDAGLAIPDLPLAYGKLLPPTTAIGLAAVNHLRAFSLGLEPVTLLQIWLHFGHRLGAILVSGFVIALAVSSLRWRGVRGLALPARVLLALLAAQITLGVLTVLLRKPADIASLHVAVGALVLMTSFLLTARTFRLSSYCVNRSCAKIVEPRTSATDRHSPLTAAFAANL
ncbi:MAG TPA: COX15/CtaA family protein [Tepidisphaeraceae bacterium]|nr:COX15/CtaA family protein [Tepidisphaeraceae bacterium]